MAKYGNTALGSVHRSYCWLELEDYDFLHSFALANGLVYDDKALYAFIMRVHDEPSYNYAFETHDMIEAMAACIKAIERDGVEAAPGVEYILRQHWA